MRPAIKELMDDHQVILRMLRALNGVCLRVEGKGDVPASDLEAALDFIRTYADHCHHGKEEDLLFPAMCEAGFPRDGGPIAVMLMEHEQGRAHVAALSRALTRVRKGETEALSDVVLSLRSYAALLLAHIGKEDRILYPMAMDAVPDARWRELEKEFGRVEQQRMGPERREAYEKLVARLLAAYPSPELAQPAGGLCH